MNTCFVKIVCLSMDLTPSQAIFNYSPTPRRRSWGKTFGWFWPSVIKSALIYGDTAKVGPRPLLRVLIQSLATNPKRPIQMRSHLLRQIRADFPLCRLIGTERHLTQLIGAELHLTRLIGAELHLTRLIGSELHLTQLIGAELHLTRLMPPRQTPIKLRPIQLGRNGSFLFNHLSIIRGLTSASNWVRPRRVSFLFGFRRHSNSLLRLSLT